MEDLKIRVHTEGEAIKVIKLAEKLGYKEALPKSFKLTDGYVCLREKGKAIFKVCISQAGSELNEFKEISIFDLSYMTAHKEYLDPRNNYELIEWDGGFMIQDYWIEVPMGANFFMQSKDDLDYCFFANDNGKTLNTHNGKKWHKETTLCIKNMHKQYVLLWKRDIKKEYLEPMPSGDFRYHLDNGFWIGGDWIEIPEGAEFYVVDNKVKEGRFYKKDDNQLSILSGEKWIKTQYRTDCFYEQMASCGLVISWQRHTQPEALPFVDDEPKHSHYFKDVSGLEKIDVYRVLELYGVTNPCLQHAIKKLLCSGERGAKDSIQDIQEAIDTLNRRLEMIEECK